MTLRIELAGRLYHVISRGDRRQANDRDDEDRSVWLAALGEVRGRFKWRCQAYCGTSDHYHVVETPEAKLSKGMRPLNGVYTPTGNRRHG